MPTSQMAYFSNCYNLFIPDALVSLINLRNAKCFERLKREKATKRLSAASYNGSCEPANKKICQEITFRKRTLSEGLSNKNEAATKRSKL